MLLYRNCDFDRKQTSTNLTYQLKKLLIDYITFGLKNIIHSNLATRKDNFYTNLAHKAFIGID